MSRKLGKVLTSIWRADDLGSAELLRGSFADYAYDVHVHETACFALITRGAIRIRMRGAEFIARRGDLFAIDANEPHAGWPVDGTGWSLRTLYVGIDRVKALLVDDAPGSTVALAGPILRDAPLARALYGVHRCSEVGGPALKRTERYVAFAARLFERHTRNAQSLTAATRESRAVRLARDFLDDRLDQQVSLAEVAVAAGLPPFRLLRAFESEMGMSPHTYQRQARLRVAARLIRLGRPLSEVAAASGFADQAHLTRSFRRSVAVTPGAYRGAFRSAIERPAGMPPASSSG